MVNKCTVPRPRGLCDDCLRASLIAQTDFGDKVVLHAWCRHSDTQGWWFEGSPDWVCWPTSEEEWREVQQACGRQGQSRATTRSGTVAGPLRS